MVNTSIVSSYFFKLHKRYLCTKIIAKNCPGCGVTLQTKFSNKPGYIILENKEPPKLNYTPSWEKANKLEEKRLEIENKLSNINNNRKKNKTNITNDQQKIVKNVVNKTPPKHIKFTTPNKNLIYNNNNKGKELKLLDFGFSEVDENPNSSLIKIPESTKISDGFELDDSKKLTEERTCVRCHQLSYQGKVKEGDNMNLSNFRVQLRSIIIKNPRSALLLIVDILELRTTLLKNLNEIINTRNTPILIAINKLDLMPKDISNLRINKWVQKEAHKLGLWVYDVLLISGKNNMNIGRAFTVLKELCSTKGRHLFVIGATNVGKSTFINKLVEKRYIRNKRTRKLTSSKFPGTTLDLIDFNLPIYPYNKLFDTPGLVIENQLSNKLNFEELRDISPKKKLKAKTYRVTKGQSLLIGAGLGRIDLIKGKPILLTIFVSSNVSIHITKTERLEKVMNKLVGKLIYPPYKLERVKALGSSKFVVKKMTGEGWNKSCLDIVFSGIGWVSVTTCGEMEIKYNGASNNLIHEREPLMPLVARKTMRKFSGIAK